MSFSAPHKVHFVGIGGAGMSAIAKVLIERGFEVSGSDLKASRAATVLEAMGASIHIGHEAALVESALSVVVSAAIPRTNPEYERADELGLALMTRGEALAALLADARSLVVAGTHGKTTTTSMIVTILRAAGVDPTYLVGAGLNDVGTNARSGTGELAVAESDESDGSFLLLSPDIAVVTNIEMDHVDHWASFDELAGAFRQFMSSARAGGTLVVPAADHGLVSHARSLGQRVITFGEGGDVTAAEVELRGNSARFELRSSDDERSVVLRVPGEHNVSNALAAAAASLAAGIELPAIASGLGLYRGVERRFQVRGMARGVTVIDDYAHHPTEVRATLAAARPGGWGRVIAVFQPHRYSRTAALAAAFGAAFEAADQVVLMDVYGAGEQAVPGVTGKLIADAVCSHLPGRPVAYFPHRAEMLTYLEATAREGDAILTLGAGDVSTVGEQLLARLGSERA
jgi:UDP-N-acetylmuramate--alanine ligase